jgi:hypothetical protein
MAAEEKDPPVDEGASEQLQDGELGDIAGGSVVEPPIPGPPG